MKKRLIALMLILTMAMTALAGCGGNDKPEETNAIDPEIPIVGQTGSGDETSDPDATETNTPEETNDPDDSGSAEETNAPEETQNPAETTAADATPNGTLVVGVNAAFPPYEYYDADGELTGLDIEIATTLAKNMGMNVVFRNMEFSALLPAIQEGDIDVAISTITATENRATFAQFSDVYLSTSLAAVVKTTSAVATLDDMPRNTVAVVEGSIADYYYSAENPEAEIVRYATAKKAFNALKKDKVDCVLLTAEQAEDLAGGKKKYYTIPYLTEDYVIALGLRDNDLLGQINTALSALKASGAIDTMADSYLD